VKTLVKASKMSSTGWDSKPFWSATDSNASATPEPKYLNAVIFLALSLSIA
jgi:hypothetical protein